MASSVKTVKIPDDIEYRVIGNAFGLMVASGGLLGGAMVNQRSLDYWQEDFILLALVAVMGFRLFRSFIANMQLYQQAPRHPVHSPVRHAVAPESVAMGQLPPVPGYTTEQVVEEVARRIEANKAKSAKKGAP